MRPGGQGKGIPGGDGLEDQVTETENVRCAPPEFGDVRQFLMDRLHPRDRATLLDQPIVLWVHGEPAEGEGYYCKCEIVYSITELSKAWARSEINKRATGSRFVCACMGRLIE